MEKIKFNKHYLGKCYINFYNKKFFNIDKLTNDLKRFHNYKDGRGGIETSEVKMYLICKGGYFFWSGFEPNPEEGYINCGNNVNYFFAVAALRDDTDENQWFIFENPGIYDDYPEKIWVYIFEENELDKYRQECIKLNKPILNYHKATLEEIVEESKDKPFSLV